MLLEISGEITPERMKGWSQSKNNTQLWKRLEISSRKLEIPTKETFHEKMGSIKDRNCKDLTEAAAMKLKDAYSLEEKL